MRVMRAIFVLFFGVPWFAPTGLAAEPATQPTSNPAPASRPTGDAGYDALLVDLIAARTRRAEAVSQMQLGLKELVADKTVASDQKRQQLLIRRRSADLQTVRLTHQLQLYWLERSLTQAEKKEFADLLPADREELLAARTIEQRLAVPLPPTQLRGVKLSDFVAFIAQECDVKITVDWPALSTSFKPDQIVTVTIAPFAVPARDTLTITLQALSGGKALLDSSHARSLLITTEKGQANWIAMDAKLAQRIQNPKLWAELADVLPASKFTQVPLADALSAAGSGDWLLVDWTSLQELGLTPQTPVDINLGAHALGHRLAAIAEGVDSRPAAKQKGGLKFDLLPRGGVLVSSMNGFERTLAGVTRVLAACKDDATLDLVSTDLPEMNLTGTLGESVDFLSDVTNLRVSADWQALGAVNLNPRSGVNCVVRRQPLCNVLALVFRSPPGRPPVEWELSAGKIRAMGPLRGQ